MHCMSLRFDPAVERIRTPPFIRWTLAHACPIREFDDYCDPERTDRLLRSARTYSNALATGRVRQGVVLATSAEITSETLGFQAETALAPLGGTELLEQRCGACPANALRRSEHSAVAGCVGYLIPPENEEFHTRFNALATTLAGDTFPITQPRWLGLWINQQPSPAELLMQRTLLQQVLAEGHAVWELADYLMAIDTALEQQIPLRIRGYAGGQCFERRWIVEPHCSTCHSAWPQERRQQCPGCGQVGGRQRAQIRKRMGTRPYRALREFLNPQQIASLRSEKC